MRGTGRGFWCDERSLEERTQWNQGRQAVSFLTWALYPPLPALGEPWTNLRKKPSLKGKAQVQLWYPWFKTDSMPVLVEEERDDS